MLLLPTLLSLLAITITTVALNPQPLPPGHHNNPLPLRERDSCAPNYIKCAPPGATGTSIPVIGPSVKGLYLNVLESVQGDKLEVKKRNLVDQAHQLLQTLSATDPKLVKGAIEVFNSESDLDTLNANFKADLESDGSSVDLSTLDLNLAKRAMMEKLERVKRQGLPDDRRLADDVVDIGLRVIEGVNVDLSKLAMMEKLKKIKRYVDMTMEGLSGFASNDHEDHDDPVKCSPSVLNGLINLGCTPVDLNLEKRSTMEELERVKRQAGIDVGANMPVPADVDPTLEEFELRKRATTVQMCCAAGTQCLLLKDFNVPFCWDKFTTNFFLPFSSYGSLTTGNYTSPAPPNAPPNTPSSVNLLSGNYTRPDDSSGNIYSDDEAAKPNTATMGSLMPTPWTSTGVGSAIPASALGGIATWTTVIEGTTVEASVASGSTVPGTTVAPVTTTVTGFEETAASTGTAKSTSSKGAAASGGHGAEKWVTGIAVTVAGLLRVVLGL